MVTSRASGATLTARHPTGFRLEYRVQHDHDLIKSVELRGSGWYLEMLVLLLQSVLQPLLVTVVIVDGSSPC